jgi:hypothetical protein
VNSLDFTTSFIRYPVYKGSKIKSLHNLYIGIHIYFLIGPIIMTIAGHLGLESREYEFY